MGVIGSVGIGNWWVRRQQSDVGRAAAEPRGLRSSVRSGHQEFALLNAVPETRDAASVLRFVFTHVRDGGLDQLVYWVFHVAQVVQRSDVIFIAVKPQYVGPVLREVKPVLTDRHLVVSIAAGVTLANMKVRGCIPRWGWC